jgi:hypothetical protein
VTFRHELARLAVEESTPPTRRLELHGRALAALAGHPTRGSRRSSGRSWTVARSATACRRATTSSVSRTSSSRTRRARGQPGRTPHGSSAARSARAWPAATTGSPARPSRSPPSQSRTGERAGQLLDEGRALASPTVELPRIGPIAAARAEAAWLSGLRARRGASARRRRAPERRGGADPRRRPPSRPLRERGSAAAEGAEQRGVAAASEGRRRRGSGRDVAIYIGIRLGSPDGSRTVAAALPGLELRRRSYDCPPCQQMQHRCSRRL